MLQRCVALTLAVAMATVPDRAGLADEFDDPPSVGAGKPAATAPENPPDASGNAADDEVPPDVAPDEARTPQRDGQKTDRETRQSNFDVELRALAVESLGDGVSVAARASAHWYGKHAIADEIDAIFNLRARTNAVEGSSFEFDENVRLDVQELAMSWTPQPGLTLLAGRVNIRNGVALGFNPTDWFKANSLIISDSQDPGDRREERLGTVVLDGTAAFMNTLFQFGYRPEIDARRDSWLAGEDIVGLGLDRTNPSDAFYLKATPDFGGNLALTGDLFVEDGRFGAGVELSAAIGDSLVLYGEVFGQERESLASDALSASSAGDAFRDSIGATGKEEWMTQLAVGGTWSLPELFVGARDVSVSLEYHFNEAGLTRGQIDAMAGAAGQNLAFAGMVRGFAAGRQEPLARDQLFARVAWNDFWSDADLSLIAYYVPADDSGLYQLSVAAPLGENLQLSLRGYSAFGSETSVYGANPAEWGVQLAFKYAF